MDFKTFKKNKSLIILSIQILLLFIILVKIEQNVETIINKCNKNPLDYELKAMDECYLTIHNFVSFNTTAHVNRFSSTDPIVWKNNQSFKTYIYSYTKPFMIELVQNATKDCLCCS